MSTKKSVKPAAKAAAKPAKKAAPAPAAKKAAASKPAARPVAKAAKAPAKAPPAKAAAPVKAKAPPAPAKKAVTPPKAAPVAKATPPKAAKAPAKAVKPEPKAAPPVAKTKPEPKTKAAKPAPAPKPAKPKPEPKVAAPKAEKPPKPPKAPKPPKPPKLAPVEAAFAKPKPAKPLAVAAGRANPVLNTPTPVRPLPPPKTLTAPKPVAEPELVGDLQAVPAFKAKAGNKGMVLVGAIAGAFGVKGEVRIRAFTERKDGVIAYGPLHSEDGKVLLKPKNWRELKDGVAVVAPEVKSKEQADAMRGVRLYVPRANLPSPAEDEFYIVDLLGCKAETVDGKVLGEICAVWNFGAGDIIEYRPPNGGPNVRVTFTKESAPLVDLAGKRVVLDPPAPEPVGK